MPIVHFVTQKERLPADAKDVQDVSQSYGPSSGEIWTYQTHHGLCIREWERNGYDDSDFYMVIWDPEKQEPYDYCFASTSGWTYPCYGSRPDATPEVLAAYQAWETEQRRRQAVARDIAQSLKPQFGREVKVVRGIKVPVGTTGEVFWAGASRYGERVGLRKPDGERVFTAVTNVEVVNPGQYRLIKD